MNNIREELRKEALRLHEDAEYTCKVHFVTAERWNKLNMWLSIPSIILSIIAGSLALGKVVPNFEIFAGISGFSAAALTALISFLRPRERYELHTKFGNKYLALRNELRYFSNIEVATNDNENELKKLLEEYIKEKKSLDADAPLLSKRAYEEAKKRINAGETEYKVDKES